MIFGPALCDCVRGWAGMLAVLLPCMPQTLKGDLFLLCKPGGSSRLRQAGYMAVAISRSSSLVNVALDSER